ncbi:MAG TPA: multicopper oxidase family protein [Terriglobales bacterium]|nr:multicopper oxidase family protein [Terriglobales bacterium]
MKNATSKTQLLLTLIVAVTLFLAPAAFAAAPGITGTGTVGTFNLTAQDGYLNQPDGNAVYSWGYGCVATSSPTFVPAAIVGAYCNTMQVPGPTMVVTEGNTVTIHLTNNLPTAAGNTSILFPGFNVTTTCPASTTAGAPQQGLLTCEAVPGGSVTYTFTASEAGTHPYYSGTQGDLQIEMGLYGAIIVLPSNPGNGTCDTNNVTNLYGKTDYGTAHGIAGFPEQDFRLAHAAYDHPATCYDREYLFQWAEMDSRIHRQALAQVQAKVGCVAGSMGCSLDVQTEPYHPAYFLINGRSMPDLMDPNYAGEYPHQPYNGNPHMHPGELTLIRTIGQGRWQHPFHEHANHVRILSRDGGLILTPANPTTSLSGILMFNTDTTPGESFDGIFYYSGRGLNWDAFGHHPQPPGPSNIATNEQPLPADTLASLPCTPDANGYNTGNTAALNYYEWCQDHNKPIQVNPLGDVAGGGPATFPDPNVFTNGQWYGGTPYFGPDATLRASHPACDTPSALSCTDLNPANTQANPATERGWAFMWHSHNEREITTNNVFPGGMLMMMLVDSREFPIDESK